MPQEQAELNTLERREPETFDPAARLYQSEWAFYRKPTRLAAGFLCVLAIIYGQRYVSVFVATTFNRWQQSPRAPLIGRILLLDLSSFIFDPTIWGIVWLTWWSVRREHRLGRADDLYLSLLDSRELWRAKYWPLARTLWLVLPLTLLGLGILGHVSTIQWFKNASLPPNPYLSWSSWLSDSVPKILLSALTPCFGFPLVVYYLMLRWPRLARDGLFVAPAALHILIGQWVINILIAWLFNSLRAFRPKNFTYPIRFHWIWVWPLAYMVCLIGLSALVIRPLARRAVPRFRELFNSEI